jgi:hypothetical protein
MTPTAHLVVICAQTSVAPQPVFADDAAAMRRLVADHDQGSAQLRLLVVAQF